MVPPGSRVAPLNRDDLAVGSKALAVARLEGASRDGDAAIERVACRGCERGRAGLGEAGRAG